MISRILRTLSGRIQIAAFAILTAFAAILLFTFAWNQRDSLFAKVSNDLAEQLFVHATRIGQTTDKLRRDTLFLAAVPPISGIVRAARNGGLDSRDGNSAEMWRQRLREIFHGFANANPECLQVRYIGVADGWRELVRVERRAQGVVAVTDAALERRQDQDHWGAAVRLSPGQVYLSEIRHGRQDEGIGPVRHPTLHMHAATPIMAPDGELFGVIVIDWDIGALLETMADKHYPESALYIADQTGRYLVRPAVAATIAAAPAARMDRDLPTLAPAFDGNAPVSSGFLAARVGDTAMHLLARRVHFDPLRRENFLVVAYLLPDRVLAAELLGSVATGAAVGGLMAAAVLAALLLLIRRAFAPLAQLTAAAAEVSKGARAVALPDAGRGDVATLTQAFREMLDNVLRKERALTELNTELEEKVRLRTADLDRAQAVGRIGSWRLDVWRNELTWSAENHRLFGIAEGTPLTYESFLAAVHPDDRSYVDDKWQAALRGAPYDFEHRIVVGGEVRWVREKAELEWSADGALRGGFGTTQDIGERKQAEIALAAAKEAADQANRAKSVFLANMSHEIRTPLHVIIGLAHLLRRDLTDAEQRQRIDQVCGTSEHLLSVINSILDLSKIEADRLALDIGCFRLDEVMAKVLAMVGERAQEKGLTLVAELAPPLRGTPLSGDALRLAQVLINLGNNAVKFTACGEVRFVIDCRADDGAAMTVRFAVRDTGSGIAPGDQARLFQAFEQADNAATREHGGTGLGLVISERLVRLMGGAIRLDSSPGKGSTFSFDIVLPHCHCRLENPVAAGVPTDLGGKRVLVAEDHRLSQDIILEMLEHLGCAVDLADDGVEAVDYAREHAYDLILMDMQMPRMDGLAAARAIRALPAHRQTLIVALTANAFAEDRQCCLDAGMDGHIAKPVTPARLAAALGQWLPQAGAEAAAAAASVADSPLARRLGGIAGLDVGKVCRRSPAQLADYPRLLREYLALHGDDMARLRRHLAAGERDAALVLVHQLKGVSGFIGAERVGALASELHAALRTGADAAALATQVAACAAALDDLAQALNAWPEAADGTA
ncbi:MAG: response regulator [Rhodocyclales bacterium]|nr:response regulator [Rhodocyclales bacterium]